MTSEYLTFKIQDFYKQLQQGEYKHLFDLAKAIEALANLAWDEVDEIYQGSIRID